MKWRVIGMGAALWGGALAGLAPARAAQVTIFPPQWEGGVRPTVPAAPDQTPSWAFLLETRTQWLMVLSDPLAPGSAALTPNGLAALTPDGGGAHSATSRPATAPHTGPANPAPIAIKQGGSTLIFEGNTLDIPLETAPAPTKPSAPGS